MYRDRESNVLGFYWNFGSTIGSPHSPLSYWDELECHLTSGNHPQPGQFHSQAT
jgi:hypothetical protein